MDAESRSAPALAESRTHGSGGTCSPPHFNSFWVSRCRMRVIGVPPWKQSA
jgi:hypothetical protein